MRNVIAADLGATNTRAALIGEDGTIMGEIGMIATPQGGASPSVISDHLVAAIREVCPSDCAALAGIGVSVAGPVDFSRGTVVHPPNISFDEIPIVRPLEKEFGLPVRLANDCLAGIIGEACFGAARGFRDVVYITISTGIGAGILSGGRILFGRGGSAGEVGHFRIDSRYDMPCGCGYSGHWEGYASGRHIPEFFAAWEGMGNQGRADFDTTTARGIFSAAQEGNARALAFVEEVGRMNARGISAVVVAYDPRLIVLDGTIVRENPTLVLPPVERYAERFLPLPEIRLTELQGFAPLMGASIIARGYTTPFGSLDDLAGQ
ncbi:MAG: ROK family protein [Methanomicrobiales archaeon]|nr:ROK family protein [Methanomicrobiales archaeon]